jgi:hypothetical protein
MLNHAHHTYYVHFGEHKAAIVTDQHPDGSVDLVYFNGGSDGMPHAATNVKHSALGEDGTFHHDSNFVYDMAEYKKNSEADQKDKEESAAKKADILAQSQEEAKAKARLEKAKLKLKAKAELDAEAAAEAAAEAELAQSVPPPPLASTPANVPPQEVI